MPLKLRKAEENPRKSSGPAVKICLICGTLLLPPPVPGTTRVPAVRHPGEYVMRFDDLGLAHNLTLRGNVTYASLSFHCESRWRPAQGSRLHLFIGHSPDLDENRSFLSVTLNYGILRSLRLDAQNEKPTEVIIPLPPDLLKPENELVFSVEQFPPGNKSSTGIWATVGAQSYIVIHFDRERPVLDLSLLPSPLIDPHSYGPKGVSVRLPQPLSLETMTAIALLVANFCARVAPAPVSLEVVRSADALRFPLLVVGTPAEQPLLRELAGPSWAVSEGEREPAIRLAGGEKLAGPEGVAGLAMAGSRFNPILYLTGSSPGSILKAARTLVSPGARFSGGFARIPWNREKVPSLPRAWRGFIPPEDRFALSALGYRELKILPQDEFSLAVPIRSTPDAQFLNYGHQMDLIFKLSSGLEGQNCQIKVLLNEAILGRFALREIAKGSIASLRLQVPAHLLRTVNNLRLVLLGAAQGAWREPAAWLLPSSEFYLPRVYVAELPNLALLRHHLYPFSLKADLSETIILLPNRPSAALLPAVLELSAALGRLAPGRHLDFRLRRLHDLSDREKRSSHFISLNLEGSADAPEGLFPGWKSPPRDRAPKGITLLQEAPSPWNMRKYVLSITADSVQGLHRAVQQAFHETTLARLRGDTAVLGNEVVCFDLAPKRTARETAYLSYLQAWLRANWLALPVILTAVSGLLFIALRITLKYYKKDG